jgi:hypothetical protein
VLLLVQVAYITQHKIYLQQGRSSSTHAQLLICIVPDGNMIGVGTAHQQTTPCMLCWVVHVLLM